MLAQVQLPLEDAEYDARHYDDDRSDFGGFGGNNGKVGCCWFFCFIEVDLCLLDLLKSYANSNTGEKLQ
ncbi:hypothetical protein HanRHA438_Chr02g0060091 [Helianthus annuus]|nr:hypothetical protein HanHA300_Chr00c0089g0707951 [Helianthus annuus]KAJ0939349.1 hypothetical protein HanRHA438_Chr02g0060091 [Helianthus annuus]